MSVECGGVLPFFRDDLQIGIFRVNCGAAAKFYG